VSGILRKACSIISTIKKVGGGKEGSSLLKNLTSSFEEEKKRRKRSREGINRNWEVLRPWLRRIGKNFTRTQRGLDFSKLGKVGRVARGTSLATYTKKRQSPSPPKSPGTTCDG